MATDLFGRPAGPAPPNPELALRTAHALGIWQHGDPLPWAPRTAQGPSVASVQPRAPIRQPWQPLPLNRAA